MCLNLSRLVSESALAQKNESGNITDRFYFLIYLNVKPIRIRQISDNLKNGLSLLRFRQLLKTIFHGLLYWLLTTKMQKDVKADRDFVFVMLIWMLVTQKCV